MYLCNGRYKIIGRLGEGGFGSVYLAEDARLKKTWAIKAVGAYDEVSYATVQAELRVLTKVSHPGIVRITDSFSSDGQIYIVMDYVKGMTLSKVLSSKRRLSERTIYKWALELCDAVAYLHHNDPPIILRDLKPQNIMVRPDGHLVLIDFGAADILGHGGYIFGSQAWAAPEQLSGGRVDVRSDIYSLGKVLAAMSEGNRPFGMGFVIRRCTLEKPSLRYKGAGAIRRDLIIFHNLGWLAVIASIVLTAAILTLSKARTETRGINERAQADMAYNRALLCFYDLKDYAASEKYLEEVPEESYPETPYYTRLAAMLSNGNSDDEEIKAALEEFEVFNEDVIREQDTSRYIKNLFCIADVYGSMLPSEKGYEKSCAFAERVLKLCDTSEEISGRHEKDALCLMINSLILSGRTDAVSRSEKYHEAIGYIDRLVALLDATDEDEAVTRLMDKAALYTELGEYALALKTYEDVEGKYHNNISIKYFAHLALLMESGGTRQDVEKLWNEILQIDGIKDDKSYELMKERVENYE